MPNEPNIAITLPACFNSCQGRKAPIVGAGPVAEQPGRARAPLGSKQVALRSVPRKGTRLGAAGVGGCKRGPARRHPHLESPLGGKMGWVRDLSPGSPVGLGMSPLLPQRALWIIEKCRGGF